MMRAWDTCGSRAVLTRRDSKYLAGFAKNIFIRIKVILMGITDDRYQSVISESNVFMGAPENVDFNQNSVLTLINVEIS